MKILRIGWAFFTFLSLCIAGLDVARCQSIRTTGESGAILDDPDLDPSTHWVEPHKALRAKAGLEDIFRGVSLVVLVDASGNVASAEAVDGESKFFVQAVALARGWKYKPFEKNGVPIPARISEYVHLLPPEDLPKKHVEFPGVGNMADVVMTLRRSPCFGSCPGYLVEIKGDGTVLFKGEYYVLLKGQHVDHISHEEVAELVEAFRKGDYLSMKDEYVAQVTDCPAYETSFTVGNVTKKITDYVGLQIGMPESIAEVEATIDRIAGTTKWISGDDNTVASLEREGWDFHSTEAQTLLAEASQRGVTDIVEKLLAKGVAVSGLTKEGKNALAGAARAGDRKAVAMLLRAGAGKDQGRVKTQALIAAAQAGEQEIVRALIESGADPKGVLEPLPHSRSASGITGVEDERSDADIEEQIREVQERENAGTTVLMAAASSAVPEIVETILDAKPDVNAADGRGRTAIFYVAAGNSYFDKKHHADRLTVLRLLIQAGANLNSQNDEGNAVLHETYNPHIARALIENGANVNLKNANGETPLMKNFDTDVVKLLVAAGADVTVRDNKGETALDHARQLEPDGERAKFLAAVVAKQKKQ